MTVTVIGNRSVGYLGPNNVGGNGINNSKMQGLGWVALVGSAAGDETIVALEDLAIGDINVGIYFQSEAGAEVEFTLANSSHAKNADPLVQASVPWGNALTVPANTITPADLLFTCCKVTFTAPGAVYVGVR